jgi:hypothetical protein
MHANIERYLNELPPLELAGKKEPELMQFEKFHADIIKKRCVVPYRTEWRIFDSELGLGGSVDFVGKLSNGSYVLMDWKRSKTLPSEIFKAYGKSAR